MTLPRTVSRNPRRAWCVSTIALALLVGGTRLLALDGADAAIYDDSNHGTDGGAWARSVAAYQHLMDEMGLTWEIVRPEDVNTTPDLRTRYRLWLMPGGWAGAYNTLIDATGYANLRKFLYDGGAYVGICAGAFFLCDWIYWQPNWAPPGSYYDYPMSVFLGYGVGALHEIIEWDAPTGFTGPDTIERGAAMTAIDVTYRDTPAQLQILYYGGPRFAPTDPLSAQWLATSIPGSYHAVTGTPPAMLVFPYGAGKVFLTGPHPEISMNTSTGALYYDEQNHAFLCRVVEDIIPERWDPARTTSALSVRPLTGGDLNLEIRTQRGHWYQLLCGPTPACTEPYDLAFPGSGATVTYRVLTTPTRKFYRVRANLLAPF